MGGGGLPACMQVGHYHACRWGTALHACGGVELHAPNTHAWKGGVGLRAVMYMQTGGGGRMPQKNTQVRGVTKCTKYTCGRGGGCMYQICMQFGVVTACAKYAYAGRGGGCMCPICMQLGGVAACPICMQVKRRARCGGTVHVNTCCYCPLAPTPPRPLQCHQQLVQLPPPEPIGCIQSRGEGGGVT